MKSYEIEVKTLLGEATKADEFRSQLLVRGAQPGEQETQLNHYFIGGDYQELKEKLQEFLSEEDKQKLDELKFFWNSEYDCWASYHYGSA